VASSVSLGTPWFCDGMTLTGLLGRQLLSGTRVADAGTATAVAPLGGVFPGASAGLQATAPASGLSVNISAGYCAVPHPTQGHGCYVFGLMSSGNLAIASNSSGHTRIDIVVARVYDLASPSSYCDIEIVQGTPNAGQPATPSASILLAAVSIASGTSSITAGMITDKRTCTVAPGGILPVATASAAPSFTGTPQIVYDQAAGALKVGMNGGVRALASPGAPVMSVVNTSSHHGLANGINTAGASAIGWGTGYGCYTSPALFPNAGTNTDGKAVTEMSVRFTADGKSDWEYYWKWNYIVPADYIYGTSAVSTGHGQLTISVDGVPVDSTYFKSSDNTGNTLQGGDAGCASYFTSPAAGTTPSAGTHTLTLSVETLSTYDAAAGASGVTIGAWGINPMAAVTGAMRGRLTHENCVLRAAPVIV